MNNPLFSPIAITRITLATLRQSALPDYQALTSTTFCRRHSSRSLWSRHTSPTSLTKALSYSIKPMEAIKQTVAQNFGVGGSHELVDESQQFKLEETPDLSGKVAVITGGSEGIGFASVHTFLQHNIHKVFVLSVSQEVVEQAKQRLTDELSVEAAGRIVWLQCELSDWHQVVDTANIIGKQTERIDILINNAARGIMTYQVTDYGVDRHMAVNHIAHVILTSHLLPIMKRTAEAHPSDKIRIVNLGSNAHQATPSSCKFASLDELNQDLGPNGQYGRSKLAGILYARYLNRHLPQKNILANATHPGFVETKMSTQDIHEPYPMAGYIMSAFMKPLQKDQFQGCVSTVFAATKTEKGGQYICPPAVPESGSALAQDEALGEQLMTLTRDIVREKFGPESIGKGCPLQDY